MTWELDYVPQAVGGSIGTSLSSIIELPYPLRGQKDWNSLIFPFMK